MWIYNLLSRVHCVLFYWYRFCSDNCTRHRCLFDSEECCCNFINQDLTFLQPSTVYDTTKSDDSISIASDSTDTLVITVQENNQPQEKTRNSPPSPLTALSYDSISTDNGPAPVQPVLPAPIQLVEHVIGLTTEVQW